MANEIEQGDQFIKSNEKADAGYGRNGYNGASSDCPGKRTTTGFAPELDISDKLAAVQADQWQKRKVSAEPIAPAYGHRGAAPGPKVPSNGRPVTRPINK
jgi:hypothetical protein